MERYRVTLTCGIPACNCRHTTAAAPPTCSRARILSPAWPTPGGGSYGRFGCELDTSPPVPCPSSPATLPTPPPLGGRSCPALPRPLGLRGRCTWWQSGLLTGIEASPLSPGNPTQTRAGHGLCLDSPTRQIYTVGTTNTELRHRPPDFEPQPPPFCAISGCGGRRSASSPHSTSLASLGISGHFLGTRLGIRVHPQLDLAARQRFRHALLGPEHRGPMAMEPRVARNQWCVCHFHTRAGLPQSAVGLAFDAARLRA